MRHSKVEPASVEVNASETGLAVGVVGADVIAVCGATSGHGTGRGCSGWGDARDRATAIETV